MFSNANVGPIWNCVKFDVADSVTMVLQKFLSNTCAFVISLFLPLMLLLLLLTNYTHGLYI